MSLIHNERVKLLANALDRASTACFAVGVLGQALSLPPAGDLWVSLPVGFSPRLDYILWRDAFSEG